MEQYIRSDSLLLDRLSNGFLLLPFYRNKLLFNLTEFQASESIEKKRKGATKRLKFLLHFKRFFLKNREILIFSSTLFDVQTENKYFNTLHGYYKLSQPDKSLLIEECDDNGQWNTPNIDSQVSYIFTPLLFLCKILAYFKSKICNISSIRADNLLEHYPSTLSERDIVYINYYSIFVYKVFRFCFRRLTKLRLIVLNCGSYGAEYASIIKAAHDLGIKVAEPQHGMINDIHFVYNFEPYTYNCTEYRQYLPDYLLTFGQFWNDHSYIPIKKIIVGHPHLDAFRKSRLNVVPKKKGLLFISQPSVLNVFIKIILELSQKGIENITLRLHPFDVLTTDIEKRLIDARITITNYKTSLYDELVSSSYIIGETSTCLYEALGLGCSILIYKNEETLKMYTGNEGPFFTTANEIISLIGSSQTYDRAAPEYYYENDFEEKYNNFLNTFVWK